MAKKLPLHIQNFHAAIDKAGGQVAFAKICGCTQGNIWQLKTNGSPLPAKYAIKVEEAELGFDRHDLAPDIYPRTPTRQGEAA